MYDYCVIVIMASGTIATANSCGPQPVPSIVKFAYSDFITSERKWTAKCQHCSEKITETRGTSSGFVRHIERKHAVIYSKYKEGKGYLIFDNSPIYLLCGQWPIGHRF